MALYDTVAFQDAVAKGASLTMENETLIVVTADHAHTMTMVGYPSRGNNILGVHLHYNSHAFILIKY
jgi:alkaline phosphatase